MDAFYNLHLMEMGWTSRAAAMAASVSPSALENNRGTDAEV